MLTSSQDWSVTIWDVEKSKVVLTTPTQEKAIWAVAWNIVGAVTFEREKYGALYSHDPNGVYQAD